jgi:glycosyltransferase involved in cell wall biosynthesis
MKKTLLQITSWGNTGSVGRIAEQIGQLVIASGWESYIVFGRKERPSTSHKVKIGNQWELYWHVLLTRLLDMHGWGSIFATKKLVRQIKQIKPDIIHLHAVQGYYLNIGILFRCLANIGIPVVWTMHDCWALTGHCNHFDAVGCDRWRTGCYHCPRKKEYPKSMLYDNSARNYQKKKQLFTSVKQMTIVTPSQWLAEVVRQSFLNQYPVNVIHNGIDLEIFKPTVEADNNLPLVFENKYCPATSHPFTILGVANIWLERKGLNDFIRLRRLLNPSYNILLVGLTKRQMKRLPQGIQGIEHTESTQQLATIYAAVDVLVNPTWEDTFPTVNLEALACGTPVITYRTGGSPESVPEECGIVVEKGDVEGLVKAIRHIKEKGKQAYVKPCKDYAVRNYNKKKCFSEYVKLYENLNNSEPQKNT